MDRIEKRVLVAAVALLLICFVGLAHAYRAYGVSIPTCVTDVRPFSEGRVIQRGDNDFEVQMVAKMWAFDPEEVVLPPGARVTLYLSTKDVVHGMQILGTNVNLMAIPGTVNYAEVTFEEEGEYRVTCHEYCGRNHQSMAGSFVIREGAAIEPASPAAAAQGTTAGSAEALFDEHACLVCHTLDGSDADVAPSFLGLFGTRRTLADGSTVLADESYLRDAILRPEQQVVEGYDPMPEMDDIPEADLEAMIEALRGLAGQEQR